MSLYSIDDPHGGAEIRRTRPTELGEENAQPVTWQGMVLRGGMVLAALAAASVLPVMAVKSSSDYARRIQQQREEAAKMASSQQVVQSQSLKR